MTQLIFLGVATTAGLLSTWRETERPRHNPGSTTRPKRLRVHARRQ
jgi:hypothetical protein